MNPCLKSILLFCLLSACANQPRLATKTDCLLSTADVHVNMHRAWWVSMLGQGTVVNLEYTLNLDPDSRARPRGYSHLGDHGRLWLWYAEQPSGSFAEVHGEGLVIAIQLDGEGYAHVGGSDLDVILAGANDVEALLLDAQHNVLRREHISRIALQEADSSMRRLSRDIRWRLRNPASRCAPLERIDLG